MSMAKGLGLGLVAGLAIGAGAMALLGSGKDAGLQPGAEQVLVQKADLEQLRTRSADYDAMAKQLADAERAAQDAAAEETGGVAEWKARVDTLEAEKQKLQAELQMARAAAEAAQATTETLTPPADDRTFRFGIKTKSPIFDKQNWKELGGHVHAMLADMPAFAQGVVDTGKPDMEIMKRLAPHNQPLASLTMSAQGEIEGTGFNGPFTHPAVMANLLRGTLETAGLPLTDAQLQSIESLGADWERSWAQLKSGHTAETLVLTKTADEVEAKQRFLEAVRALLTPAQLAAVSPESTRDRLQLDLFSPVFVWQMRQARSAPTRDGLKPQLLKALLDEAKAPGLNTDELGDVADRWLQAYGDQWLQPVPPRGWDMIFVRTQRLQAAARAQAAAAQELIARGQLSPEQIAALRKHSTLYTPYVVKAE